MLAMDIVLMKSSLVTWWRGGVVGRWVGGVVLVTWIFGSCAFCGSTVERRAMKVTRGTREEETKVGWLVGWLTGKKGRIFTRSKERWRRDSCWVAGLPEPTGPPPRSWRAVSAECGRRAADCAGSAFGMAAALASKTVNRAPKNFMVSRVAAGGDGVVNDFECQCDFYDSVRWIPSTSSISAWAMWRLL